MTEIKKSRLAFLYLVIIAVFAVIILRMFLVVLAGDKIKVSGLYDPRKGLKRANIFDRNDVLVATDLKTQSLYVSSILVKDVHNVAQKLSSTFPDLSYEEILKKLSDTKRNKRWILIRRNLTPVQSEAVKDLQLAGLLFEDDLIRVYPQKSIASHFVGYVDLDRKGLSGMEMQYDQQLINDEELKIAMDVRVQDILHDNLANSLESTHAKAVAGIVMNVNNGEIIALSSLPSFDPNLQHQASEEQRFNRITSGVYELGSVLKAITNSIAFEENLVKINDVYNVKDPIKYGRFTISDDHPVKDEMTVGEIFAFSSNIGTVKIAEKIGIKTQKEYMEKFGFLRRVDAEFPGLGKPIYPKHWRDINLYTISYGHGIAISPLHLASAISALINGGMMCKPSFLKLKGEPDCKRILKETTSAMMRLIMRKTVLEGTGRNSNVEGYEVGGKTGTANLAQGGSYNERQTLSSFVGVFPISNPQYLVYILFDRPSTGANTGGMVAAPVVGNIIRNIAPILGVRPVEDYQIQLR